MPKIDVRNALGSVLDWRAAEDPATPVELDRPSDVWPEAGHRLDVGRLAALAAAFSGELHAAGVRSGDRVVVHKRNHIDIVVLSAAIARIGAVPALLSERLDEQQLPTMLTRLDSPWLVTDTATLDRRAARDVAGLVHRTIVVDAPDDRRPAPGEVRRADLRGAPAPVPAPVKPHQTQAIYHTSGTTGVPKLVAHSAESHLSTIAIEMRGLPVIGIDGRDRAAACLSWVHARCAGALLNFVTNRPRVLALSEPAPTPETIALLREFRPTLVEMLPNGFMLWEDVAESPDNPFAQTRLFHSTFDAIHPRTVRRLTAASSRRFPLWIQTWGQSETGAATAQVFTRRSFARPARQLQGRRVGRPVPFATRVRVVDPETKGPLPAGTAGALEVSTDAICLDYVGQEDLHTKRHRGRWWTMGDIGIKTRTGQVLLLDREVDLIDQVRSGVDVEDVLLDRLPELQEIVVVRDASGRAVPVVATATGEPVDRGRWSAAVRGLPTLADPVLLRWEDFPRTATLKVRRHLLRARLDGSATPAPPAEPDRVGELVAGGEPHAG